MSHFDPNAAARPGSGAFGLDSQADEAAVHLYGVPVEATTSYRRGTKSAPDAIREASLQVDLTDLVTGQPWKRGIFWFPPEKRLAAIEKEASKLAKPVIEAGGATPGALAEKAARVDELLDEMTTLVHDRARASILAKKVFGVVGGDHSTPLGSIRAHAEAYPGLGVLQFDAHLDLRDAYEGFRNSHASIVHNVAATTDVASIVGFGIRDVGADELDLLASDDRLTAVFAHDWARARNAGGLVEAAKRALEPLPEDVYVTFDVDGLDPTLCPNTGTPVPGGLLWDEATLVLEELVASGRRLVGFDLVEVAPEPGRDEGAGWDEIVGARLLYRLLGFALKSREGRED